MLESNTKTEYNHVQCMNKKGMNQNGDLYIVYTISVPSLAKEEYYDILKDVLPNNKENSNKKFNKDKEIIILATL